MPSPSLDAVLHPVRWRIVQTLTTGPATVRGLREHLRDVPQATLYRHLQPLLDAGLVQVVGEEAVRGATERTYALASRDLHPDDFTGEDHRRAFVFLQNALLGEVEAYLDRPDPHPEADGLSYTHATVHLTDDGRARFQAELAALVERHLTPTPATRPLTLGLVMVPGTAPST